MWDVVGHILFPGVYIKLYIGDSLFVVLSCNRTQCRGLGTYSYFSLHYCNLILVNICLGPPHKTLWGWCWCPHNNLVSEPRLLPNFS